MSTPPPQTSVPPRQNRLAFEKSPYLLQHSCNPVDWYPWGGEAFHKAKTEDKPILLSIGYSSCHWCHVMERESFEDPETANLINSNFVAVKVDREQRPDVDDMYMLIVRQMTGSGGWPLTIFMTAQKVPFYCGTYFPKEPKFGRSSFMDVLQDVVDRWTCDRRRISQAVKALEAVLVPALLVSHPGKELDRMDLQNAISHMKAKYDPIYGGVKGRMKFPQIVNLLVLLYGHRRFGDSDCMSLTQKTLHRIRKGGIFDQIGWGVHRYSTDPCWMVPHFEKMLYDQALLVIGCVVAYRASHDKIIGQMARETLSYVLRELRDPEAGCFFTAQDADSEAVEGKYYLWKAEEVIEALGTEDGAIFNSAFGVTTEGNLPKMEFAQGLNVPHLRKLADDQPESKDFGKFVAAARRQLFRFRNRREPVFTDKKLLVDWNALMIVALTKAHVTFEAEGWPSVDCLECSPPCPDLTSCSQSSTYLQCAQEACEYILKSLRDRRGRLAKMSFNGESSGQGLLDDHAFMTWALLELYNATLEPKWLVEAKATLDVMIDFFWDAQEGGFFCTPCDAEPVLVRLKPSKYGGAIPGGNAIAAICLWKSFLLFGDASYEKMFKEFTRSVAGAVSANPPEFPEVMLAADLAVGPSVTVTLSGIQGSTSVKEMVHTIRRSSDAALIVFRPELLSSKLPEICEICPFTTSQRSVDGQTATAYVCVDGTCQPPTTDPDALAQLLVALSHPGT